MAQLLRHLIDPHQDDRDQHVAMVELAMNYAIISSTQNTDHHEYKIYITSI